VCLEGSEGSTSVLTACSHKFPFVPLLHQATTSGVDAEAVDYAWVREYHYQPTDHQITDQMVFFFSEGIVTYVPFESKLMMQKQKSRGMQDATSLAQQDVPRPSAIKVKKRKYTEAEEAERSVEPTLRLLGL
jgi:hypothetical protein